MTNFGIFKGVCDFTRYYRELLILTAFISHIRKTANKRESRRGSGLRS